MEIKWNAHVNVENAKVGLGWGVTDDVSGGVTAYATVITLTLPQRAAASVSKKAPNETVVLNRSASLTCDANGIEANVTYRVTPLTGTGKQVAVSVAKVAGQKPPATGDVLGRGTGQVGEDITVHVVIPGSCA
ncbi:MAG TPA: hypothetical protein VE011_05280 [Candidatus Dormibacteraeota bacterium]|nr:hypothetical protein [Candidatus Dormibacteraeota bacterium]